MHDRVAPMPPVRLDARPHGIALVAPLARAVAVALAGGGLVLLGSRSAWPLAAPGAVLLGLAALAALRAVLAWDRTRLVVTRDQLVVVHGVLRRRSATAQLGATGALEVDQSVLGRVLGYGTLVAGNLEVPYVPGARRLARGG